jgi:antitoxin ParD1/3/4
VASNVQLPPELERFAKKCVASGRYSSFSEVVRSGLRLLQEVEERRIRFNHMLEEVRAEAEREGYESIEQVLAEMDEIIARHDEPNG